MPLRGSVKDRIRELYRDNAKHGKERGAKGKKRSPEQIAAIAYASFNRGVQKRKGKPKRAKKAK